LTPEQTWFADGYSQVWSVAAPADNGAYFFRSVTATERVVVTAEYADGQDLKQGWDRADGTRLWSTEESTGGIIGCRYGGTSDQVLCATGADGWIYYMVDPATGEVRSGTADKQVIPSEQPSGGWGCEPDPLDSGIIWSCSVNDYYDQPIHGYVGVWTDPEGRTLWQSDEVPVNPDAEGRIDNWTVAEERDGLIVLSNPWAGRPSLLDAATGRDLLEGQSCEDLQVFADGHVWCRDRQLRGIETGAQCNGLEVETTNLELDDGASVTLHRSSRNLVGFFDGYHPPDVVYLHGCEEGYDALDPASGDVLYLIDNRPIVFSLVSSWGLWGGGDLVAFVDESGTISAVEAATGEVVWDRAGDQGWELQRNPTASRASFLDQGTLAFQTLRADQGQAVLEVFDARTGEVVMARRTAMAQGEWSTSQDAYWHWNTAAQPGEPYVIEDDLQSLTLWEKDPEAGPAQVEPVGLPDGLPRCPDGQEPLVWSQFGDDYVIVCATGDATRFSVLARQNGAERRAVELTFTEGGCAVQFDDQQTVYLSLGGAYVTKADGSLTAARDSWSWRSGRVEFDNPPPDDWLACPAGSWPIALATYGAGHVLVFGTALDRATLLKWRDGELGEGESGDVAAEAGGWCASAEQVKACTFAAPALVSYTPDGADQAVQRPVDSNYFDAAGAGGTGRGKGAYNVDTPQATAADQVRYLVEVLEASAANRADVEALLRQVDQRQVTDATIAGLAAVADSRARLAQGVESAPVSEVPGGPALAAKLQAALETSEAADRMYVEWAEAVRGGADPAASGKVWEATAHQSEVLKQEFVDLWNAQIAPQFSVREFRAAEI
jgi:hypothetical protein